ncbi:hypothetical protein PCANC_01802 [Puccinia coronata f. sp. avenae]|uniref:Uncharacterized protein n=1 Tax=Puccinia coronata f. sp. avenae TaxID=200324 RepID=A0A2N5T8R4_9BASI|nr:hypothetical protein PCANC_03325 [Puccinia coronata f. sp. avenae]PLW57361.1 hypothetical protein PCANC_01802 [Puccinia coronata f. sp. avenae]
MFSASFNFWLSAKPAKGSKGPCAKPTSPPEDSFDLILIRFIVKSRSLTLRLRSMDHRNH